MSWIDTIPYEESEGKLKRLYERVKGPDDNVDNIMMAHSLRPHTMEGHMVLYKNVLHHSANEVPKWFLECLGVYVSQLNRCLYCAEHHFEGLSRLLDDESRSAAILEALESERFEGAFTEKEEAAFHYARILTLVPHAMQEGDFGQMKDSGWSDGETLEVNQVVAYFNYANRMVLGLGITTEGDQLGLSPGDLENPENWQHA
jgi:uncharacterized peroxidase-related enzyme